MGSITTAVNQEALIALKKGSQLIKYSRKGKPKFRAFRLSADETLLIWYSHGEEKNLKLSTVQRIIPGQRTAVFRRYLRPEKEYLSFSLVYNNGERSLDLICKDKLEAEVWFAGLKALIGNGHSRRTKSDFSDDSSDFGQSVRSLGPTLEPTSSISRGRISIDSSSRDFPISDVGSERSSMQLKAGNVDGFRLSVSSTPSCSSQGSGPDDIESLGDVYIWGAVWSDWVLSDGSVSPLPLKSDVLTPKPLESNVVLDVHQIACGDRHVALVTRQGEVFTWGEESGGRLGHGNDRDFCRPHLVEFLAVTNVDFVACGQYHTCAVSTSGDLFTWGDGSDNAGLLGHGTDTSHWIPKRVSGFLEGFQVLSIACGTWHSALATSSGKLFTFGDGTFGVLGHGGRESVSYPREVQSLNGLKTIKVACGVWHTAAIVEVTSHSGSNVTSRKLFTWGDGEKYRLGHGNKDSYLVPTCVSALIDYNFQQLACGHTMTVALTTSGHVFTMGGTGHGQLGTPTSDGKVPCLVQDKLVGEFVEEISCGAYHVAALTSRSEVFTWGMGANGRLGHGDTEDRKTPTLVESLKDRHVRNISCGSNFTASICIHKWVSGADQSVCSGCRQAFGFTRKRHNCYNCGLVHCHSCSSKKALKAALAPTPGKPHRVCDSCYAKLKAAEAGKETNINRRLAATRQSIDSRDRLDRRDFKSMSLLSSSAEPVKSARLGSRPESPSLNRYPQVPSLLQLKEIAFPSSLTSTHNALKPVSTPSPQPPINSRPPSPPPLYSRKPSPPRAATPGFSRSVIDSLRKTNEILNQEVMKLQNQMKTLRQKCDAQDVEIKKLRKNAEGAASLATEKSFRCAAAMDIVVSVTTQLREMAEKLPPEIYDSESFKSIQDQAVAFLNESEPQASLDAGRKLVPHKASADKGSMDYHVEIAGVADVGSSQDSSRSSETGRVPAHQNSTEHGSRSKEKEIVELFEPGVYVCLVQIRDGTKVFKRVKFSKKKFDEEHAEKWWKENKDRVLRMYSPLEMASPSAASDKKTEEKQSSET